MSLRCNVHRICASSAAGEVNFKNNEGENVADVEGGKQEGVYGIPHVAPGSAEDKCSKQRQHRSAEKACGARSDRCTIRRQLVY